MRNFYQFRTYLQAQRILYILMMVNLARMKDYIDRWNKAEDELASLFHLSISRPLPTVLTIGGVIDVTYVLDTPHGFEWKGVFMDADLRAIEIVGAHGDAPSSVGQSSRLSEFMKLSSLQGSILENRIFEEDFQVESISTAKLFGIIGNTQPATEILTIDKTNIATILPTLPFDDNIKEDITNTVNQNYTIRIPQSEITYQHWTGIGYIKENTTTGESGYMLSGMIAGGMTAQSPEEWVKQYLRKTLGSPYTGKPSKGPVAKLIKIPVTDRQYGIVGKELEKELAVLALDSKGIPVEGASITFRIVAGGGNFNGAEIFTTTTGINGIAKARFTLGQKTSDNPNYMKLNTTDNFVTQIGLNIITASASSSSGTISINQPFEAYGKPDVPKEIIKAFGDGTKALVNNPAGSLRAVVVDQYGNPISNQTINFTALPAVSLEPLVPLPLNYRNIEFYKIEECNIPYPLYGDCPTVNEKSIKTEYFGAIVNTILGNTVGTKYTVGVTGANLPSVYFNLYSEGFRNKDDYIPPGIYIRHLQIVNDRGEPVNASKAGTELKAPLVSELFMLYDEYKMEGPYPCTGDPSKTCWKLKVSGIVNVKPITNGTVTFTPIQGGGTVTPTENLLNGKYRTRYTTGIIPAVNKIEAPGEATVTVPKVFFDPFVTNILVPSFSGEPNELYNPLKHIAITEYTEDYVQCSSGTCKLRTSDVSLKSGQQVIFYSDGPRIAGIEQKATYTVYGVLPEIRGTIPNVMLLDSDGYLTQDATINYSIKPIEYNAIIVDIDIYERPAGNTNSNDDVYAFSIYGDKTQGEGTATVFRGTRFTLAKEYYGQVVLNKGSEAEIRGDRVKLAVTNKFVKLCKRDLNICDPTVPICFESRNWEWVKPELHHAFISIKGETFGFSSHSAIFSLKCIFEGEGAVEPNLGIDHAAEIEGYMHGSCQPVGCENPDNLRNHIINDPKPYYCLMPNSGVGMNCQEWANMMINTYCSTSN